jgi:hypothetical protein
LILAALGLLALVPTKSKAQDFSFSVGVAPGYYEPGDYNGGYCDPGYGYYYYRRIIIAQPTIQVITMATATTAAIIAPMSATTMINRGPMRSREKAP